MGYTHYQNQRRDFTAAEWTELANRVTWIKRAAGAVGIALAGPEGLGAAVIDGERIAFNGRGEPGGPFAYETCEITRRRRESGWSFTKTSFDDQPTRPYDAAVVAVFEAAATSAHGALTWDSDGDEVDLAAGFQLLELADRMRELDSRTREMRTAA